MSGRAASRPPAGGRRAGPWAVLVPLAALLILLALLLHHRRASSGLADPPVPADPDRGVAGFQGRLAGDGGGALEAQLSALHPEPERQAFDAAALRQRLGQALGQTAAEGGRAHREEPGERGPWRLVLSWRDPDGRAGSAGSGGGDAPRTGSAPPGVAGARVGLGLSDLRVVDDEGVALRVLPEPRRGSEGEGPFDPLATVLAPPSEPLYPGQTVDVVLWGRAPRGAARLEGLLPDDAELGARFAEATGLSGALELVPERLRRSELFEGLARFGRAAGGVDAVARRGEVEGEAALLAPLTPREDDVPGRGDARD